MNQTKSATFGDFDQGAEPVARESAAIVPLLRRQSAAATEGDDTSGNGFVHVAEEQS